MCFFLGLNLRTEVPLLVTRLRKSFLNNDKFLMSFSFGLSIDYLSFPVINFGNNLLFFKRFLEGKIFFSNLYLLNDFFSFSFLNVKDLLFDKFSFFLGTSFLLRLDSNLLFESFKVFFSYFYGKVIKIFDILKYSFNIVSNYLGRISCFEFGFLPGIRSSSYKKRKKFSFLYLLGTDNFKAFKADFVVFQGSFNDFIIPSLVFLVFPVSIYIEKLSIYLNIEGRLRFANVVNPQGYSDLDICIALYFFKLLFVPNNFSVFSNFYFLLNFFFCLIDYSCFFYLFFDFYNNKLFSKKFFSNSVFCFSNKVL